MGSVQADISQIELHRFTSLHPVIFPSVGRYVPEEDEEENEEEDHDPYGGRMYQTVIPQKQPWQTGTLVPDTFALHAAPFDERPITPMKNTMVYSREHSTLDFKDGRSYTLLPTEKRVQFI